MKRYPIIAPTLLLVLAPLIVFAGAVYGAALAVLGLAKVLADLLGAD